MVDKKKMILVVDDRAEQLDLLVDVLSEYYTVLTANSGYRALEVFFQHSPTINLILIDVRMPDLDGHEVVKIIRSEGHNLPIICQTACEFAGHSEKCLAVGMTDYLIKPINIEKLLETVKRHLT